MTTSALTTQQKKSLRGIAHHLSPVVAIGDKGMTEAIIEETQRALTDHELIKIKVHETDRDTRTATLAALAKATASEVLQKIGKVAILYRRNPKPNPRLSNIARYLEL